MSSADALAWTLMLVRLLQLVVEVGDAGGVGSQLFAQLIQF
jgi:hypothetical protein